jgi:hypothetical protein
MRKAHTIYGLKDPLTGVIRYIGYTSKKPEARLTDHVKEANCKGPTCHRYKWLRKLFQQGLRPTITVLEVVTQRTWQRRERYWIKKLASNNLVNNTQGGEGLCNPSEEVRQRIGLQASRAMMGNQHLLGYKHREDSKRAIGKGSQAYWTWLQNIRLWLGDDFLQRRKPRLSNSSRKRLGHNLGKKFSLQTRARMSAAMKGSHSLLGARKIIRGRKTTWLHSGEKMPRGWRLAAVTSSL